MCLGSLWAAREIVRLASTDNMDSRLSRCKIFPTSMEADERLYVLALAALPQGR